MKDLFFLLTMILVISLCFFLIACTYSINMVHTQGSASDVVDENQTPSADVRPNITLPAL